MLEDLHIGTIVVSTVHNAPLLIFAAMAGLFAERSGVIDLALEGKILASAFVSAAVAYTTQNPWYGVAAGVAVSAALALLQGFVSITQKGNQLVGGIAIALMGRQHPVGIFLSSVLFGALIQGGFDLSLEKPNIPQETFIFIQCLIILFCGAMENFYGPALLKLINLRKG